MDYKIGMADTLNIENTELTNLLTHVYVKGGFTEQDEAKTLFEASSVRNRGILIAARETRSLTLAGIVIVVPPHSQALRLAKNNEAEIHLLGVLPEHRQNGLGRKLVQTAIDNARQTGCTKIILWTQCAMKTAQQLYEACGFINTNSFNRNNRDFIAYELKL